jgi:hypothetical protein
VDLQRTPRELPKLKERSLNVYENKRPTLDRPARSRVLTERSPGRFLVVHDKFWLKLEALGVANN